MNKAVFLDKDGTLIPDLPYNVNPHLITLEAGAIEGLRLLQEQGYLLIIVSNQSGVAKGYFKEEALRGVIQKIKSLLLLHRITISDFYYCPHFHNGVIADYARACDCRKPAPGLLLQAAADHNIDLSQSWMIGDILNDIEAGSRAGCRTILIDNGNETEWLLNDGRIPDFKALTITEASQYILQSTTKKEGSDANDWFKCKHILCIRPDNLGDLLMSTPAIRALKETFQCKITVLTSSMASSIVPMIPEIDDVIVCDLPWVKHKMQCTADNFNAIVHKLKERQFDACVLFTVYSQNPLPTAMLAYLAGIPRRLAYCRENPYSLLTNWVPDQEPYTFIQHQVRRDLDLVAAVGATTKNQRLSLDIPSVSPEEVNKVLLKKGVDPKQPLIVIHAGVSEEKRKYAAENWVIVGRQIIKEFGCQVLLTGVKQERVLTDSLAAAIGGRAYSVAGEFSLEQFVQLIKQAVVVISVNTATVHLSAAVQTPVVVLYALTNPQHAPWKGNGKILLFDVADSLCSKNEVIRYVHTHLHPKDLAMPSPEDILQAVRELLTGEGDFLIPELIPLRVPVDQLL